MDTPQLERVAISKGIKWQEAFDKAMKIFEDGITTQHIWNVDYVWAKDKLTRLSEALIDISSQPYNELTRSKNPNGYGHGTDWGEKDPRWMTVYHPHFMNAPGAVKKLEKFEGKEDPTFSTYVDALREIAQVVDLIKSVKPYIEKGRKPSENPVEKDVTNTGICPVCLKRQKLNFNETLVAHGYTLVRGWGGRNGMCIGHGYKAWELSPEGAIAFKKGMENYLAELKTLEDNLRNSKSSTLSETVRVRIKETREYKDERRTYDKGTPEYERLRKSNLYSTEANIRYIIADIEGVTLRITNWKLEPLKYGGAETQERWNSRMLNKKQ